MQFTEQLDWRRAVKAFDPEREIPEEILQKILHATQMAPSSLGIQPYHIYVVKDAETKAKIREFGYDQEQFTSAPVVLVFASRMDLDQRIDDYIEVASGGDEEKKGKMGPLKNMLSGYAGRMSEEERQPWADKQTFLALGFAMAAAAELEVHSCAMEGFVPEKMDELLELPDHMKSAVCLCLGYTDKPAKRPKVRFPKEDLFTEI